MAPPPPPDGAGARWYLCGTESASLALAPSSSETPLTSVMACLTSLELEEKVTMARREPEGRS